MKKSITATAASLLAGLVFGMSINADNVVIEGKAPILPDGSTVDLIYFEGLLGSTIASDTIKDGNFYISFQTDSCLKKVSMYIHDKTDSSQGRILYITPGADIQISGQDRHVQTWNVNSNIPEQADYDRYLMASKDIQNASYQIYLDYLRRREESTDKHDLEKVKEEYKATKPFRDSLDNIATLIEIDMMKSVLPNKVWLDKMEEIVSIHKGCENEAIIGSIKRLYESLDDSIKTSRTGIKIKALLYPPKQVEIGEEFPGTKFHDMEGNEHSLQELQGKWAVVVFWATACGGCHYAFQEMPKLIAKNKDKLDGVLLSCDTDKWWRWATENFGVKGNNWNEGKENFGLSQRFGDKGFPTVVMVDPKGKVADIFLGFYTERIEENLKKEVK